MLKSHHHHLSTLDLVVLKSLRPFQSQNPLHRLQTKATVFLVESVEQVVLLHRPHDILFPLASNRDLAGSLTVAAVLCKNVKQILWVAE
jgi:hypothetical protein